MKNNVGVVCVCSDDTRENGMGPEWPVIAHPQPIGPCTDTASWKWDTFGHQGKDDVLQKVYISSSTFIEFQVRIITLWGVFNWFMASIDTTKLKFNSIIDKMTTGSVCDMPLYDMVQTTDDASRIQACEIYALNDRASIKFNYHAICIHNNDTGSKCLTIGFHALELKLNDYNAWATLPKIVYSRDPGGDKIVMRVDTPRNADNENSHGVYLGRAQDIYVNQTGKDRAYMWLQVETCKEFGGIPSPRQQAEELNDLKRMHGSCEETRNMHTLVSPRFIMFDGVWNPDAPNVKNPCRRLPIVIKSEHVMELQIFNLRYEPPRMIAQRITYNEFQDRVAGAREDPLPKRKASFGDRVKKRLSFNGKHKPVSSLCNDLFLLERHMGRDLRLCIQFKFADKRHVVITRIRLDATHFKESLVLYQQSQKSLSSRNRLQREKVNK